MMPILFSRQRTHLTRCTNTHNFNHIRIYWTFALSDGLLMVWGQNGLTKPKCPSIRFILNIILRLTCPTFVIFFQSVFLFSFSLHCLHVQIVMDTRKTENSSFMGFFSSFFFFNIGVNMCCSAYSG